MPFSSKKAKQKRYYLLNLGKTLSNRKENYTKNREAVKGRTSSYHKEMRLVNKKERAATRHNVKL